jgi:hypothetical protein
MNKHRANRLGFAILLAFFRDRGRFLRDESEVEPQGIAALQLLSIRDLIRGLRYVVCLEGIKITNVEE